MLKQIYNKIDKANNPQWFNVSFFYYEKSTNEAPKKFTYTFQQDQLQKLTDTVKNVLFGCSAYTKLKDFYVTSKDSDITDILKRLMNKEIILDYELKPITLYRIVIQRKESMTMLLSACFSATNYSNQYFDKNDAFCVLNGFRIKNYLEQAKEEVSNYTNCTNIFQVLKKLLKNNIIDGFLVLGSNDNVYYNDKEILNKMKMQNFIN